MFVLVGKKVLQASTLLLVLQILGGIMEILLRFREILRLLGPIKGVARVPTEIQKLGFQENVEKVQPEITSA